MTLPVPPDVETILRNSAEVLRDVVLPETTSDWARSSAALLVGALDYAVDLLKEDHGARNRAELAAALVEFEAAADAKQVPSTRGDSPFETASTLLVWAQDNPGSAADAIRSALHPVLREQLDRELASSRAMFSAMASMMRGSSND